jgi:hypothetical protein
MAEVERFERRYDYDAGYMKELIELDAAGGLKLALAAPFMSHRFEAPRVAYFAAKVRSSLRADCGPCLELVVRMAWEAGVSIDSLLPALGRGRGSPEVELAIRFTDAVIDNAANLLEVMEEALARFGEEGRAGLAAAVVAGQFFPLLKRGLGHGRACAPVAAELFAARISEDTPHAAD